MSDNAFNLGTVLEDAVKVITNPIGFYQEMPTEGGYTNPLIFVVVMAAITGLLMSLYALLGFGASGAIAGGMAVSSVIIFPIMAVIGSFIGAAIMFVIWKLMGSEQNYEVAYRCVAYSMVTMPIVTVLAFIPYVTSILRTVWGVFLMYAASIGAHNIKAQTAKIVFGILAVIGILYSISAERTARKWQDFGDKMSSEMKLPESLKDLENIEDMTPEEAGKQVGELLKNLGEFSKGLEASVKEAEIEHQQEE